jgi:hypothetical protein
VEFVPSRGMITFGDRLGSIRSELTDFRGCTTKSFWSAGNELLDCDFLKVLAAIRTTGGDEDSDQESSGG